MEENKRLEIDDILIIYSDLINKYSKLQRRSATADKQLAKFMSDYAELLMKKNGESSSIVLDDYEPIKIEVVKNKKK